MKNTALFFHLLGAFLLVSGTVVAGVAFEVARRRTRADEVALVLRVARIGSALVGAGSVLVLAFGLWLVHLEHVGYGTGWVDAALALFVAMGALGGIGGRTPRHARERAEKGEDVSSLLDDPRSRSLNYLSALLLLAIVALMVFKP